MVKVIEWLLGISVMFFGFVIFGLSLCFNLIGYGIWEIRVFWNGTLESLLIMTGMLTGISIIMIGGMFCYSATN